MLKIAKDKVAAANNGKVNTEHQSSQWYIPVFVDAASYDVDATSTTTREKNKGQSQALHKGTNHAGHKLLVANDVQ